MWGLYESLCIDVAEMHLEGPAPRWFQLVEPQHQNSLWSSICCLLHDRFAHNQHQLLIRQLFSNK